MTQTVAAEILVHASNLDSPRHRRARALVDHLDAGPQPAVILWPTVLRYLRITTHPGIFPRPLAHDDAVANISELLQRPNIHPGGEEAGFWATYCEVAVSRAPQGDQVPDTYLMALMYQQGVSTLWTTDHHFRRFEGIRVLNPFSHRYRSGFT